MVVDAQFMQSHSTDVRSMQMAVNGEWGSLPVITLGSDDEITFAFDEMSHSYHRYRYRIVHCDADWNPSDLLEIDYLDGFNDNLIEWWENSENTTILYTNYQFSLPNDEVQMKLSGNYKVEIIDEDNDDELVATFSFAVIDRRVGVALSVSGDTDRSFNTSQQQLDIKIAYGGYNISSPASDVKVVVYQNRRMDNAVCGIKPTYITGRELEYVHNDKLIFDAGNEYRRFELTDPYSGGMNVDRIEYFDDCYNALLYADRERRNHSNYRDENGRYYINTLEGYGSSLEADYAYVHFTLDVPYRTDGDYYLLGDAWGNSLSDTNMLVYDNEEDAYISAQLLKFGLYNYMYVWVPRGGGASSLAPSEGSFYNTENEYLVFVYHHSPSDRYDRLVGVGEIKSAE